MSETKLKNTKLEKDSKACETNEEKCEVDTSKCKGGETRCTSSLKDMTPKNQACNTTLVDVTSRYVLLNKYANGRCFWKSNSSATWVDMQKPGSTTAPTTFDQCKALDLCGRVGGKGDRTSCHKMGN